MKLAELFLKLGVDADTEKVEKFHQSVTALKKKIAVSTAVLTASAYAVNKYVESFTNGSIALRNFNLQTDLSIEQLQKWQVAGQLSDTELSFNEISGSIQSIQDNLTQIRLGGGNIAPFQMLGIDTAGKNAFDILEDIRDKIQGLDSATATNLIQSIGLTPGFINVLRLGRQEFEELSKISLLNPEERGKLIQLGTAWTKLRIEISVLAQRVGVNLVPVLISTAQLFRNIQTVLVGVTQKIMEFENSSSAGAGAIMGMKIALIGLLFILAPIKTILGAVVLLVDDFITFLNGGDSAFEGFYLWLNKIHDKLKPIRDILIEFSNMEDILLLLRSGEGLKSLFSIEKPSSVGLLGQGSNSATVNNTYNITSTERAEDVGKSIAEQQQKQLNYTFEDFNIGSAL